MKKNTKVKNVKEVKRWQYSQFIYILVFIIFALIAYAILQIKMFGMKIKDFWSFIEANQMLDKLYKFAKAI